MDGIVELISNLIGWAIYGPQDRPRWWAIYLVRFVTFASAVVFILPPMFGVFIHWPMWFGLTALFVSITVMGAEYWHLQKIKWALSAMVALVLIVIGLFLSEGA